MKPSSPMEPGPSADALLVRRAVEAEAFLTLAATGHAGPPEAVAFDFQGGVMLLHVVICRDYNNPKDGPGFLPDAKEAEPLREIRSSFMLGPLPPWPDRSHEKQVTRRAIFTLEPEYVRLITESSVTRGPGNSVSTNRNDKSTSYRPQAHPTIQPALRVRMKDFLAAPQHALKHYISNSSPSLTTVERHDQPLPAGSSDSLFWRHDFHAFQTVLIAECLPFGSQPDESSLRGKIATIEAGLEKSPEDRLARYHLAWAYFLLRGQPKISEEERRSCLQASVELLTHLSREEPANIFARNALREHLLAKLAFECSAKESDQVEPVMEEFLKLQPVFDETLSAAQHVLQARDISADQRAKFIARLMSQGLSMSWDSASLTQVNLRRYAQVFTDDRLSEVGGLKKEQQELLKATIQPFEDEVAARLSKQRGR